MAIFATFARWRVEQVFRGHVLVVAPPFEQAGIEMWRVWGLGDWRNPLAGD